MSSDRPGEPWPGATYNGFSGTGAAAPLPPSAPRRGVSRRMLAGGVALAATLGLLFGVLARPDIGQDEPAPAPMKAVAAMPIEVVPVAPPAPVKSAGRLEVLPPDLARAAEPPPLPRSAPRPVEVARAPPEVPAVARAPEPSFACSRARSRSERMVCEDAVLARLDRRLDRAFERAVAAGVPFDELRAEQDDWLAIREDAARRSPDAVESVYRQRIRELDDLAG